ncbi:MAG: hypothetical protein ACRDQ5_02100 [Sciscionella sp.]
MVEQLDRLVRESHRPNVRLGIVEWTTSVTVVQSFLASVG